MTIASCIALDVATKAVAHVEDFYRRTGGFTAHQLGKAHGAIEAARDIIDQLEPVSGLHVKLLHLKGRLVVLRNTAKANASH